MVLLGHFQPGTGGPEGQQGLDDSNGDQDAWQRFYDQLQLTGSVPPAIPANYIALAAGTALCPKHKDFVLSWFGGQSN